MANGPTIQEVFDESFAKKDPSTIVPAYDTWKGSPSPQSLRAIINELHPVIDHAVSQYVGQQVSPTVHHRARLLAARAVQGYDPTKGANLKTHVFRQLQALQQLAPRVVDPMPMPERFRQHQQEIVEATGALQPELGRDPTDEEVSAYTGLPHKRVIRVRSRMRAKLPLSVMESESDEEDKPDIVDSEHTDEDHWRDAVYHDLGDQDRLVFMHRTGYRGAPVMSNQDIAKRLNISPAAVTQRAARIQRRLDEYGQS